MKFDVEFYETVDGEQPAKDFLNSLDKKMRAKISDTIVLLRDNGNALRLPYSEFLEEGIFELRAKVERIFREYYISFALTGK